MNKSYVTDAEGNIWQTPSRSGNGGNCVNARLIVKPVAA
jgi:hypothetical protein